MERIDRVIWYLVLSFACVIVAIVLAMLGGSSLVQVIVAVVLGITLWLVVRTFAMRRRDK